MSKKLQKALSLALMAIGIVLLFTMSADGKIMNVGIMAVLIGLIWFIIA